MPPKTFTKNTSDTVRISFKVVRTIIEELRLLRQEIMLLLPHEDLDEYANPDRIKNSYLKAIRRYPPFPSWK